MVYIITGGAGYIGSHLAKQLLRSNHRVFVIDNFSNSSQTVFSGVTDDILEVSPVFEYPHRETVDAIFHLAGTRSVIESWLNPIDTYEGNLLPLARALELLESSAASTFVYCSSTDDGSPYSKSVRSCEELIRDTAQLYPHKRFIILRCSNVYGGEDHSIKHHGVFEMMKRAAMTNIPFVISESKSGDGSSSRDFIHIDDVVRAFLSVMSHPPGFFIYNVSSNRTTSIIEMVKSFSVKNRLNPVMGPQRMNDVSHPPADNTPMMNNLDWKPISTHENGFWKV